MQHDGDDEVAARRERMIAWIETFWDQLASVAWHGYVTEGRGVLLLQGDWQGEVAVADRALDSVTTGGEDWPAKLVAAVRDYQPTTDIICLYQQAGAGTLVGMRTVPPRLAPPAAGQRDGAPPLVPSA